MSFCRSAAKWLALYAALAAPAAARAGEIGATSRSTVSISITIPPHVIVNPVTAATGQTSRASTGLCVETNGFSQYHLALVRHSAAADQEELLPQEIPTSKLSDCPSGNTVQPSHLSQVEGTTVEPLTLLIVAD